LPIFGLMSRAKLIIGALATAIIGCVVAVYLIGALLSAPALHPIGPPPPDLGAVDVEFEGIRGWFVRAAEGSPCVILMHGVRSDRRSMIGRARFLKEAGYSSLLFDFQAHGESPGKSMTFGYLESANARAAVAVARSRFQCSRVAAIGQSLGGAAALLGAEPLQVDALILESVYPTLAEAVSDRLQMRFGAAGRLLAPLLTFQLKPRLGIEIQALRPIDHIPNFSHPIFVLSGTEDQHTPIDEARRLFGAAREPKEFWAVQGAAHVDLHGFSADLYRQRILEFLDKYIGLPDKVPHSGLRDS
jgi:fermentation-respiration switch protein FrsA (DUF1100 family)